MRVSIGVPGVSIYFDHGEIKPFLKAQSKRVNDLVDELIVQVLLAGTCKSLEIIANNSADAHDYLITKLKASK